MHWLLWVPIILVVLLVIIRVALIAYIKTIPNFGGQTPCLISEKDNVTAKYDGKPAARDQSSKYFSSVQWQNYNSKISKLSKDSSQNNKEMRMYKKNTNTYRAKDISRKNRLNFNVLNNVIGVYISDNEDECYADIEASGTYDTFFEQCYLLGYIPSVTPELRSITVGGAIVGGGIESSSFRYGLVHESMIECDVLLADSSIVTCNATNEYSDLFRSVANSLGSLGYLLRVRMKIIKCKKYLLLKNTFCGDHEMLSQTIMNECETKNSDKYDFIDGIAYENGTGRVLTGRMIDNYDGKLDLVTLNSHIYHRYVNVHKNEVKEEDALFVMPLDDYIWRWDGDLFWCIQYIWPLNQVWIRQYLSVKHTMRSDVLRHMHEKIFGRDIIVQTKEETAKGNQMFVQDIIVPKENVCGWLDFHFNQVLTLNTATDNAIKHPLWLCPTIGNAKDYTLTKVNDKTMNVNFGFWCTVAWDKPMKLDKFVEDGIKKYNAVKWVYSTVTYAKDEFYSIYGGEKYFELKKKYDKNNKIRHLYEKCTTK